METTMYLFGTSIAVVMAGGWLLLLAGLAFSMTATVFGPTVLVANARAQERHLWDEAAADGVLGLHGVAERGVSRLRREFGRVLKLAPEGTKPKACACIKGDAGQYVGVLRIFNQRGHFMLREAGRSTDEIERGFKATLGRYRKAFPAEVGQKREHCPECNPKTCPLRRAARERRPAPKQARPEARTLH